MMSSDSIYVYAKTLIDKDAMLAGRLDFFDDRVEFRYAKSWLKGVNGFAFHPDLLPLNPNVYSAKALEGPLSVFRDAGPGAWGREVIKRLHGQADLSDSLILSNNLLRIGVFRYSKERGETFSSIADNSASQGVDVSEIYSAVKAFENAERLNQFQSMLLDQGSSMDGMRPKTFVNIDGASWILKFPSKNDYDNQAVNELIGMKLAHACGIETPDVRLVSLGEGKQGLAVKRFDTDGKNYYPLMSIASAMGFADGESFKRDYRYAAQTLTRISGEFQDDRVSLFKRMALNVMISNKDDHIFNQAMLLKNDQWKLSPVYDVVCGEGNRRDHAMIIGNAGASGNLANVLSSSESFGLEAVRAKEIVDDMIDLIASRWRQIAINGGVDAKDAEKASWAILHEDIFHGYERRSVDVLLSLADTEPANAIPDDVVKSGTFTGRILDVLNGVVMQNKGLDGEVVRHDAAKLSAVPEVGALVKIQYGKDERGTVTDLSRKVESKARSRA